jgi:hypothetical protein
MSGLIILLLLGFKSQVLLAQEIQTISAGEKLEREMWQAMKSMDWNLIESRLSDAFQSAHQDGARGKDEEFELIKKLKLSPYTLSDFKITESGSTIIVSYFVSVEETIDGKILPTKPAERLSVWLKEGDVWRWIAHANLNPMK